MAATSHRRRLPAALLLGLLALLMLCGMTGVEALPRLPGTKLVQRLTGKGQVEPPETKLAGSEVRAGVCSCDGWCWCDCGVSMTHTII